MITGYATLESAVEAMKHGAFYYIAKPFRLDEVRKVVAEALEKIRLKRENRAAARADRKLPGQGQDHHPGPGACSGCWRWRGKWRRPTATC